MYKPELEDFLAQGLSLQEACLAMEAYYSCAIEGAELDEEGFKGLCNKILKKGK